MHLKRKALELADGNASPRPMAASKRSKAGGVARTDTWRYEVTQRRRHRWSAVSGSKNLDVDLYEDIAKNPERMFSFLCVCNPLRRQHMYEAEDCDMDTDMNNTSGNGPCDNGESCPCGRDAVNYPDYSYTVTRAGLDRYDYGGDMFGLRDPDTLGVRTFDNHAADGAHQVVQNMMLDFDDAFTGRRWMEAWSIVEGLGLFLCLADGLVMCESDDRTHKARNTARQVARMPLAILSAVEAAGMLATNAQGGGPRIRNAGFIIAIYIRLAAKFRDRGVLSTARPVEGGAGAFFKFDPNYLDLYLLAVARWYGITVPGINVGGSDEEYPTMPTSTPITAHDPWGWTRSFGPYAKADPEIGGDWLDMSTWSSEERTAHSLSRTDPLPRDLPRRLRKGLRIESV